MSKHSAEPATKSHFRSDIQGLRALAVVVVLLYHANVPLLPGGFVGVDIFFVISGFLITTQLLKGIREHHRVDLVDFYGRRARRILPAALVALAGTVILTLLVLPRSRWDSVFGEATASVLFVVNWMFGQGSTDYLRQDEAASPLQHFWSLAVEEQFYLFWPLVLMLVLFLWRRARIRQERAVAAMARGRVATSGKVVLRRMIVASAVILFSGSLIHSVVLTAANPGLAYFATTTRVYELVVGVLLALFSAQLANLPRLLALVLGWLGLAAMVGAAVTFSGDTSFPGAAALVPTLGAAAVIVSGLNGRDRSGVGAVMSLGPVVWVGNISYSLYLWHWPLIVMATYIFDGLPWHIGLAAGALSVLPAWASYRWVERPFQRWSFVKPPWRAIQVGLAASLAAVIATVSLGVYSARPTAVAAEWQPPTYGLAMSQAQSPEGVAAVGGELFHRDPEAALNQLPFDELLPGAANVETDLAEAYPLDCVQSYWEPEAKACHFGPEDAEVRIALVGDSHAAHWHPAVNRMAAEHGWRVTTYLKAACHFTSGHAYREGETFTECEQWNDSVMDELTSQDFDLVLTSASAYGVPKGEPPLHVGYAEAWEEVAEAGPEVGVIMDPPLPGELVLECMERHPDEYMAECSYEASESTASGSTNQRKALEMTDAATPVDLDAGVCPEGTCQPAIGGVVVWRDASHLTATFADSMGQWLGRELEEIGLLPG